MQSPGASAPLPGPTLRILVADDEPTSQLMLSRLVRPFAHTVDVVATGSAAVEAVKTALARRRYYDVIFLDVIMPGLDGHGVITAVQELEREAQLHRRDRARIVMASALSDLKTVKDAFAREADDYIAKPLDRQKLTEVMHKLGFDLPAPAPSA